MPDNPNLNWLEVTGILARLGIEQVERYGAYTVFVGEQGDDLITIIAEDWDVPFDDLLFILSKIGGSRTELEAALESLYSDH